MNQIIVDSSKFDNLNLIKDDKSLMIEMAPGYYIHDGYKISFHQAEIGICLAIDVKNKIKGKFTIYDILNKEDDNEHLIGRKFIPFEGSRHQVISYIDCDRTPINTIRNYRQQTLNYLDYYQKIWNIKIYDEKQPLIIVDVKDPQFKERTKCYVPELCYLVGISDEDAEDFELMREITKLSRLAPDKKVEQIEKCLELFYDTTEKKEEKKEEQKEEEKEEEKH